MPRNTRVLVAILATLLIGSSVTTASDQTLKTFDACWKTVQRRFYDPNLNNVDWEAAKRHYRPQADRARPGRELRKVLQAMLSELGSSHTTVLHPAVYRILRSELTNRRSWTYGILLEETDPGFFFVRALFEGGPAQKSGLTKGDRVVLVNGRSPDRSPRTVEAGYDPGLGGAQLV